MVRDGKTGRVITAPPEEHLWTYRKKQGFGAASKNEWQNILEVGPDYCALTDRLRQWRFGFDDYYDVFIWDFVPGQTSTQTYNVVITVSLRTRSLSFYLLTRAHRNLDSHGALPIHATCMHTWNRSYEA